MLRIDFLFLDRTTCTRCLGAARRIEAALAAARDALTAAGTEVELNKIHIESAAQARELRFVSSPMIRVGGRDVALELRESPCGSEACTDGCGESIDCRMSVHDGREHTEPPVELIRDAILTEIHRGAAVEREPDPDPYELPENLKRFFTAKATPADSAPTANAAEANVCCSPAEQATCCEPDDKAACCGTGGSGCSCR
jgi:Domain of unknown function (DUF2703)